MELAPERGKHIENGIMYQQRRILARGGKCTHLTSPKPGSFLRKADGHARDCIYDSKHNPNDAANLPGLSRAAAGIVHITRIHRGQIAVRHVHSADSKANSKARANTRCHNAPDAQAKDGASPVRSAGSPATARPQVIVFVEVIVIVRIGARVPNQLLAGWSLARLLPDAFVTHFIELVVGPFANSFRRGRAALRRRRFGDEHCLAFRAANFPAQKCFIDAQLGATIGTGKGEFHAGSSKISTLTG
jgi:hypothetical protein